VTVWGRQAENCGQYLAKGSPVLVEGKLHEDTWDDKETGQKRHKLKVVAQRVQFLEFKKGDGTEQKAPSTDREAAQVPPSRKRSAPAPAAEEAGGGDEGQDNIPFRARFRSQRRAHLHHHENAGRKSWTT
jgi:single-strand DNA-binding protein